MLIRRQDLCIKNVSPEKQHAKPWFLDSCAEIDGISTYKHLRKRGSHISAPQVPISQSEIENSKLGLEGYKSSGLGMQKIRNSTKI